MPQGEGSSVHWCAMGMAGLAGSVSNSSELRCAALRLSSLLRSPNLPVLCTLQ